MPTLATAKILSCLCREYDRTHVEMPVLCDISCESGGVSHFTEASHSMQIRS